MQIKNKQQIDTDKEENVLKLSQPDDSDNKIHFQKKKRPVMWLPLFHGALQ